TPAEVDDGSFRDSISAQSDAGVDAGDRGDVDDGTALAHATRRLLRSHHDPVEINAHDALGVSEVVLPQPPTRRRYTRVVQHQVERADTLGRELHRLLDASDHGHIGMYECGGVTELADECFARVVVEIGDDDARTLLREQFDDRSTDAVGTTGDD